MKVLFCPLALAQFRTLLFLARNDQKAMVLVSRISFIIADLERQKDYHNCLLGYGQYQKNEIHNVRPIKDKDPNFEGIRWDNCIFRDIDATNTIIACDYKDYIMVVSCIGTPDSELFYYTSNFSSHMAYLNLAKFYKDRDECSLLEQQNKSVLAVIHDVATNSLKAQDDDYSSFVIAFNKSCYKSIFSIDLDAISKKEKNIELFKDKEQRKILEQTFDECVDIIELLESIVDINEVISLVVNDYAHTVQNFVNYSNVFSKEMSEHDNNQLITNKRELDKINVTYMLELARFVRRNISDKQEKQELFKVVLQAYKNAYSNQIDV